MSEFCETAGHNYKSRTITTYTIPERKDEPDFPVILGTLSFLFLVGSTIASGIMLNPMPMIGGILTFIIAMGIYIKSRFQKKYTSYLCSRCGKIIGSQ